MKFSTAFTSLILILPLLTGEALGAAAGNGGKGGNNNKGAAAGKGAGAGAGKGAAQNGAAAAAANNTAAAGAAAANNTAAAGAAAANNTAAAGAAAAGNNTVLANNGAANNAGAANNNADPQTSTTLNPAVIAPGFAQNGQQNPVAGQVASLTSTNNFINFCLTVNKPITDGKQIKTGSCNPAPMGVIAATTNMPSSKFVTPVNGQDFAANAAFTISMAVNNLQTGNFVNAQSNYYSAPQQVNGQGTIIGHTHFTVQQVPSFTSTAPLDPNVFAFFKGVNAPAVNGVVSESVAAGLPAGSYRVCSINTDANHTPCLVAVAQHGSLDDCVYFSVGGAAGNNPFAAGNAAGAAGNATGAAGAAGNATGAAGAAGNATGAAGAAGNATGAAGAAGKGAAGGQGKGAGQGAGAGKAKGGKKGARKGRKVGGRKGRKVGGRESRLGRDY